MTYAVTLTPQAQADLLRLHDFLLERAQFLEDLETAEKALSAIEVAMVTLGETPFLFRKAEGSRQPLRRELVVPFGASGYVLKYEIASPSEVVVLAVRHQHEADYP